MNKRLLLLNGISIIAVAVNHATTYGYIAMFWWTDRYMNVTVPNFDQAGSANYYLLIALQKLALFCVPAFLFTSGNFLAFSSLGSQNRLTWKMIFRRILTLIPPYLLWTLVSYASSYLIREQNNDLVWYLKSFVNIETAPLFFITLLIVYYLLSPFLVKLAKSRPGLLLGIGGLFLVMGMAHSYIDIYGSIVKIVPTRLAPITLFLREEKFFEFFFYYALGLVSGCYHPQFKRWAGTYKWVFLTLIVVMGTLAILESAWITSLTDLNTWRSKTLSIPVVIYAVSCIFAFVGFDNVRFPFENFFYYLGKNTLGIYMIHINILRILPKILYHVFPLIFTSQAIFQLVLVTAALATPLLIMETVRRLPIRVYSRYLFG